MNKQRYSGPNALKDYLRPDEDKYSPLVELPEALNPFLSEFDIHINIKLLNTLPLSNVKSMPAWNMLATTEQDLTDTTIVESSSGNTVFSLGILAKHFGAKKVMAVASRDVSPGKLDLLRIGGVDVQLVEGPLCPDANDPNSSIAIAKRYGEQDGWFNPGQYDNDANPAVHRQVTGPQIYNQLNGEIAMFVAGLGTTGTLLGTAQYLRSKVTELNVIGIVRVPNNAVPGVRTKNGLNEVAFDWDTAITDELVAINEYDSYEYSLRLIRQGLLVGPSAGFAYAGVLSQLTSMQKSGTIESLRGKNVVFVAPDSMFPYIEEYIDVLGDDYFPAIDNQLDKSPEREASSKIADVAELTVDDIYNDYTRNEAGDMKIRHYTLVDVRDSGEYLDHHLPDSINIPYTDLPNWLDSQSTTLKPLVFVCRRGSISLRAAQHATQQGYSAYSMLGGTTKWSDKDYPRIKPLYC
jgi:cysteine synthase/rhodanese-related sulfurtransferase